LDGILIGRLADLDESALLGIIDSSSAQSAYLSKFADTEARAMAAVTSVICLAAEQALLARRTGVRLA
jgi:hypothetical protein